MKSMNQRLMMPRIITGAIMMSVLIYGVVLMSISQEWTEPPDDQGILPTALTAISIGMLPMIAVLRKVSLGSLALIAPPVARSTEEVSEAALDAALSKATGRYTTGTIIGLALSESIAIYGFMIAFLTHELAAYVPNALIALTMMAVQFPREAGLLNLLGEPERAALARRS